MVLPVNSPLMPARVDWDFRLSVVVPVFNEAEALPELHFPGVAPETTQWLVDNRDIKALGLDTPSMDHGQSKDFKTHQILLGRNKPGFENLANLNLLPEKGIYIVALPMKIGKGSGGPLRIIASVMKG